MFIECKCVLIQIYNRLMKNDSGINDLMPWQTLQVWDSPFTSHKTLLVPSPKKKNQSTIHSRADFKSKEFFRTKRSSSYTEKSQKNSLQPKKKVNKLKQKINFLNAQLEQVAYATVMKNWAEKTVNTCPIKVTKVYNEIFEDKKSAFKKISNDSEMWKKIQRDGLQNFTKHQTKQRNMRKDNFKVSFSQFLEMRKNKKSKNNVARKTVTETIEMQPAIHVKIPHTLNPQSKNTFMRENQVPLHKSAINVKARRKLVVSTMKRSLQNSKLFQQFQLNISKCQDLKTFSLSNYD